MRHTASLRFDLEDADKARAIEAALRPEAADGPPGTHTEITQDGAAIDVRIDADDLAGLRAALHGVVRLVDAADKVIGP